MTTRLKMIFYTTALFVSGAVCGAAVLYHLKPAAVNPSKVRSSEEIACLIRHKLSSSLGLSKEQMAKFDPIIIRTSEELENSHRTCLDRINAAIDCLHTQICKDLTPEQKRKLKKLEAQRAESGWEKYRYQPDDTNTTIRWP